MDRKAFSNESTEFRSYALDCLFSHCFAEKPRLHKTAEAYVIRATGTYDAEVVSMGGVDASESRRERILSLIRDLIDADDQRSTELIEANDWAQTTRVVLLYAAKKYRKGHVLGKQLTDYLQDAVTQLLDRSRHWPHYRGVELNAFLCETVRSLIDHERQKAARQPTLLKIVGGINAKTAAGEYSEHLLPPANR